MYLSTGQNLRNAYVCVKDKEKSLTLLPDFPICPGGPWIPLGPYDGKMHDYLGKYFCSYGLYGDGW